MRLIRDLSSGGAEAAPSALAIGNFDGLHRGHQALIRQVCARSDELVPALMCFEPLPLTLFQPASPVPRLYSVRDRVLLARGFGLDRIYMMRFNRAFAALSPEAFVARAVCATAGARVVAVGEDFHFGARAAGDVELLIALGRRHGFEVAVVPAVEVDGERVSSSGLRQALSAGDMARVRAGLGRPYVLSGRVLRGRQLGRTLGYPTVNLRPPLPPAAHGIFAVRVSGGGLQRQAGVASLGRRPTVAGQEWLLEAHLFDYDGDLYRQHLSVEMVQYLRGEVRFDSLDAMRQQMDRDAQQARAVLSNT